MGNYISRIMGVVFTILFLVWSIPYIYFEYIFMLRDNYEIYVIWGSTIGKIFLAILVIVLLNVVGYIIDKMIG